MDKTYIQSQRIVERYLTGDLTVREAREFEKYCLENPDVMNALPIPVRVKAKMQHLSRDDVSRNDAAGGFDPTATDASIVAAGLDEIDDADDDEEPQPRGFRGMPAQSQRWVATLGVACLVALIGAAVLYFQNGMLEKELLNTRRAAKEQSLRAPGSMRELLVKPSFSQPNAPTVSVGQPEPPQLIELRIDVSASKYNTYLVTIDNVDLGRIMQIRRVTRDTNRELRLGLNSSAFVAGDYDIKLEGYTWRGDTVPMGWVRLGFK